MSERRLAYIHIVEGATQGERDFAPFDYGALRRSFSGAYIANNGYTRELAVKTLSEGRADLVAFGRPFISNPDLVERLRLGAALAPLDRATLFGGGAHGYTDYPALADDTVDALAERVRRVSASSPGFAPTRTAAASTGDGGSAGGNGPSPSVASASSSTDITLPRQTKRLRSPALDPQPRQREIARDPGRRGRPLERPARDARQRRFGAVPDEGGENDGERRGQAEFRRRDRRRGER